MKATDLMRGLLYLLMAVFLVAFIYFNYESELRTERWLAVRGEIVDIDRLNRQLGNGDDAALKELCRKLRSGKYEWNLIEIVKKHVPDAPTTVSGTKGDDCADWIEANFDALEFAPEEGKFRLVPCSP